MPRVFAGLSVGNLLVLAATMALGFLTGAVDSSYHIALGVFSLLLTCLIQVLAFTYLAVTFKMMVQAIHLGQFSIDPLMQAKYLRKKMASYLGAVFAGIVLVAATGAMNWRKGSGYWFHWMTGISLFMVLLYLLVLEFQLIAHNVVLVDAVMRRYANRTGVARRTS